LKYAAGFLGAGEYPPGSNRGPFVEFCQQHTWLKGTGWPWCAAFAVTVVQEGGGVEYPDRTAGAWDLLERARKRGWACSAKTAVPGDLVVFNIGSGHVGVVEKIENGNVISIDGNAGDAVSRCTRPLSKVRGFVHWPEDVPAHKPVKAPKVQVVGSASGTRKLVVAGKSLPLPKAKDKVT